MKTLSLVALAALAVACGQPDAPDTPTSSPGGDEIRFDNFKADAPASPTAVISTRLGAADGDGPVLELVVTDVWGRLPDRKSDVYISNGRGEKVHIGGYLRPVLIRLDAPGTYALDATIPDHYTERLKFEVRPDGEIPVPADSVRHWSFSADDREVNGQTERVYSLYLGIEHRLFAASGAPPRRGNHLQIFDNGRDAWARFVEDLAQVRERLHLSLWLMRSDFELVRDPDYRSQSEAKRWDNTILAWLRRLPGDRRVLLNEFWGRSDFTNDVFVLDGSIEEHAADPNDGIEVMLQANETEVPYYDSIELTDADWSYRDRLLEEYPEWAERSFLNEETVKPSVYNHEVGVTDLQLASYHQKFAVLDDEVGYLGGMNMNSADWDTPELAVFNPLRMDIDASNAKRRQVEAGERLPDMGPRRDYMVRIEGPLVADLEALFQSRWDLGILRRARYAENATSFTHEPAVDVVDPNDEGSQAQLTVTLPMPFWEHSLLEGMRRAVESAETYIFIEDQYFRAPVLNDLIFKQMTAHPDLVLIVVTKPVGYTDPGRKWTAISHRTFMEAFPDRYALLTAQSSDFRVRDGRVYGTFAGVDLHSKLLIVDDHIMSVGSCNKNNRGLVYEGEANLLIEDADLVSRTREAIFQRLVGPEYAEDVVDPRTAFDVFLDVAERNQRVYDYWDDQGGDVRGTRIPDALPQGLLYPLDVPYHWWFNVGPDFY